MAAPLFRIHTKPSNGACKFRANAYSSLAFVVPAVLAWLRGQRVASVAFAAIAVVSTVWWCRQHAAWQLVDLGLVAYLFLFPALYLLKARQATQMAVLGACLVAVPLAMQRARALVKVALIAAGAAAAWAMVRAKSFWALAIFLCAIACKRLLLDKGTALFHIGTASGAAALLARQHF